MPSTNGVCANTIGGWLWYCDTHDTHGNADSEAEAKAVSSAHVKFKGRDGDCDITVFTADQNVTVEYAARFIGRR